MDPVASLAPEGSAASATTALVPWSISTWKQILVLDNFEIVFYILHYYKKSSFVSVSSVCMKVIK